MLTAKKKKKHQCLPAYSKRDFENDRCVITTWDRLETNITQTDDIIR